SADRLVDLVWGEDPPRTAAHSVQIYVSELRKAFGGNGEVIVTRRPGYVLQTGTEAIDARRFERLVGEATSALGDGDEAGASGAAGLALGLWGGSPLADFTYDEFAQRDIERLNELHHRAVAVLCEVRVSEGRPLEAVPMLRDAVRDDPLREESRRLLMLALFAGGRQAEALREFRDYRDTLAEDTGLDPSPELLRLEEQILLRDPSLVPQVEEPASVQVVERNPYKGLRAFGEADTTDFFGRDELIERLLVASTSPLTAVVGPSGSGKSSVVRAGLIPILRQGAHSGSHNWTIVTLMPGRYPFAEFDAAIHRISGSVTEDSNPNDDTAITRSILRSLPTESELILLVVDQFEELFTLTDETTRRAFLRNLVTAVDDPRGRIKILLTVRADFYDRPLLYPEFAKLFTDNVVNVIPLTPAGIEAAALGPAQRVGVGFAPDLLAELVADMTDQPGALPLFQYTLTELFDERDNSTMTLDGYRRIGGLAGALSRRADAVYASIDSAEQETTRDVFLRLVKPTEDRYTRRPVPVLELESIGDAVIVSTVLTRFGEERLLTFDRDSQTGAATVEVSHEALLSGWDRLDGWLEDARLDLMELDGLMAGAAEWELMERDSGYLLSGAKLTDCEAWNASAPITLPLSATAYLTASTEARRKAEEAEVARIGREARVTRRARVRLWGMLAAVVALFAALTFAAATVIGSWGPAVVLLFEGPGDNGWNDQIAMAVAEAEEAYDLTIGTKTASALGVDQAMHDLGEAGTELVLNGFGSQTEPSGGFDVIAEYPDTNWVVPDSPGTAYEPDSDYPNVSFPVFAEAEGSFLVGAAAALKSETGTVGFLGGMDAPIIWAFQAGFEAGVHAVDPSIVVLVEYLSPYWDSSGFTSPSAGANRAKEMYREGADVIYTAAGASGEGAMVMADRVTELSGVQRWHIGVDVDEYIRYSGIVIDPEYADYLPYSYPEASQHILTSMLKRTDTAFGDAIEDYSNGVFTPGVRVYNLANDGVDYSRSGGFIEEFVPVLEEFRQQIIDGEIEVPLIPDDKKGGPSPPDDWTEW
ncbi:MAG: BMP family ABC transporter substrate-binding protein, partial [Actinomycetia bacterium]|nr:BMP family ABC transporter substrate-binding protein [Actinomycetes bacterium]